MADPRQEVYIDYTNWRGERGYRRIRPIRLSFENNEWHPETQWILEAVDIDKGEERSFALSSIHNWFSGSEISTAETLLLEKVSTSYLQRKMKIGYNRASAIMNYFERIGRVSEPSDVGVRTLLAASGLR